MNDKTNATDTVLDALAGRIADCAGTNDSEEAPCCVLWPDKQREFEPMVPRLREKLPLYTLGDYAPDEGRGPAIWLRCVIAGTITVPDTVEGVPVLYLPGVSVEELANIAGVPDRLKPLVELQFRGAVWKWSDHRDWTLMKFITDRKGLEVETAGAGIEDALLNVRVRLTDITLSELRARAPLTKAKIEQFLTGTDFIRELLRWLTDTDYRGKQTPEQWSIFVDRCKEDFGFDPEKDGRITAARKMGLREGAWNDVWNRWEESPQAWPGIPELLRQARPPKDPLFSEPMVWPQDNEVAEAEIRAGLSELSAKSRDEAVSVIKTLEKKHGKRRDSVWARLGQADLARALGALAVLCREAGEPVPGTTPTQMAESWTESRWQVDAAVLDAVSRVRNAQDLAAVSTAINTVYAPWLKSLTERFQLAVESYPLERTLPITAGEGECLLFTDGLRWDVAKRLREKLTADAREVGMRWVFGPLPSVTSTAKPAISPAAELLGPGTAPGAKILASGAAVNAGTLRTQLESIGYQVLTGANTGDPAGRAWTECGNLDQFGHAEGLKMARRADEVVNSITDRVRDLLSAGWKRIRIVTDHGWLLLPGGLPKEELAEHLTELRKGRCAVLKPSSFYQGKTHPWHWDKNEAIAVPRDICCYEAGKEYEHGGLSLHEVVLPVLDVTRGSEGSGTATIKSVRWFGMRCAVEIGAGTAGMTVCIRRRPADPSSTLAEPKAAMDGKVNLPVADDTAEGSSAFVVLLREDGTEVTHLETVVGGDE